MAEEKKDLGKEIGRITHYFDKIGVAVLELSADLKTGDTILISGHEKELEQKVDSMQVNHMEVREAKAGETVGMKVAEQVKKGDLVYLKAE